MSRKLTSTSGFTLLELMIVISIIATLVAFVMFPYSYYMKRSYVDRSRDSLGQEWIIAHKEVRNGKLFTANKHASIVLVFERSKEGVERYLLSGSMIPSLSDFRRNATNPNIKFDKFLPFDPNIKLQSFGGFTGSDTTAKFGYIIKPPYGDGGLFTNSSTLPSSLTGIILTIGYNGATTDTGHARVMLLRPYLQ